MSKTDIKINNLEELNNVFKNYDESDISEILDYNKDNLVNIFNQDWHRSKQTLFFKVIAIDFDLETKYQLLENYTPDLLDKINNRHLNTFYNNLSEDDKVKLYDQKIEKIENLLKNSQFASLGSHFNQIKVTCNDHEYKVPKSIAKALLKSGVLDKSFKIDLSYQENNRLKNMSFACTPNMLVDEIKSEIEQEVEKTSKPLFQTNASKMKHLMYDQFISEDSSKTDKFFNSDNALCSGGSSGP
ncbi:MAG: hypothetical protein EP298_03620 [Gammaproteobacteria bacterium]|nr:MAG: hypothetical protein EP298_03620 [Gammaproteobacteria bacterium]UTW43721.1 hypothetical protein KFE69_06425 [bacterium SCSIO 12844]